jgi:hypothetical protein
MYLVRITMPNEKQLDQRYPIPQPRSEVEALELELSRTAANWRASKDAKFVKQYHDTYHKLRSRGWDHGVMPKRNCRMS